MVSEESSSCCSSSASSHAPSSCPLFPLCDRFKDIPVPMRTQIIGTSIKIMQDNIKEIAVRNLLHGLGWAGGRCRACVAELARAVKVAEGVGVEVEEKYKSFLADLQDQEGPSDDDDDDDDDDEDEEERQLTQCRWICLQVLKRQREEEEEEKEEKDREFKRRRNSILAYMKSLEEAEEDDNDEEEEDDEILEIYD